MAEVVNIMIWLFFQLQYVQNAHHKADLNHEIECLRYFSVKMLDHVLTGFISSNLKSSKNCEDKECEGTNKHKSSFSKRKKHLYTY